MIKINVWICVGIEMFRIIIIIGIGVWIQIGIRIQIGIGTGVEAGQEEEIWIGICTEQLQDVKDIINDQLIANNVNQISEYGHFFSMRSEWIESFCSNCLFLCVYSWPKILNSKTQYIDDFSYAIVSVNSSVNQ